MNNKIKFGDLLKAFEDAYFAGFESGKICDSTQKTKEQSFSDWLDEELKQLD
jgi:hypothetical protein